MVPKSVKKLGACVWIFVRLWYICSHFGKLVIACSRAMNGPLTIVAVIHSTTDWRMRRGQDVNGSTSVSRPWKFEWNHYANFSLVYLEIQSHSNWLFIWSYWAFFLLFSVIYRFTYFVGLGSSYTSLSSGVVGIPSSERRISGVTP